MAILSPSLPGQPWFDDRRGNGDDATDSKTEPGEPADADRQRTVGKTVAHGEDKKQQRAEEPPQQARCAMWAHASGYVATASISTPTSFGSASASTALRAGGAAAKYVSYVSFMASKSSISAR